MTNDNYIIVEEDFYAPGDYRHYTDAARHKFFKKIAILKEKGWDYLGGATKDHRGCLMQTMIKNTENK